jgi:ubiquinone/menaquinone biosynthesis C-methylase UbiE
MIGLRRFFSNWWRKSPAETGAEQAYDLWASCYDAQPDNLVLALDEELFRELLEDLDLRGRTVLDVGCGTGRHWPQLFSRLPASVTGYDVSQEMLNMLKAKFPDAAAQKMEGCILPETSGSCQLVISTLALAHMPDAFAALQEWERVLEPGGDIILTDYHPEALKKGTSRTFKHEGKLHAVKNYVYPIERVEMYAKQLNLTVVRFIEKKIDESVRSWYDRQGASTVYERYKGTPIVYGIHIRKQHAPV